MDHVYKKPVPPEPVKIPDFELFIGDKGGRIDNGDVPIRWCISKEYITTLEEQGVVDPHVLIASYAPNKKSEPDENFFIEMDRKLVPLTEMMTYLRFSRAGNAKVYAIILDGSEGREFLHIKYTKKTSGAYDEIISKYSDALYEDLSYKVKTTHAFVEIPAGVFGSEPSEWTKWYVNAWHLSSNKIVDECHYRRRWMIAFGIKWMAFIPWTLILILGRTLMASMTIMGGYGKHVSFFKAFRPYKYYGLFYNVITKDIKWFKDNMFIYYRKNLIGEHPYGKKTPMIFGLAFMPITILVMAVAVSVLNPDGLIGHAVLTGAGVAAVCVVLFWLDCLLYFIESLIKHEIGISIIDIIETIVNSITFKVMLIGAGCLMIAYGWKLLLDLVGVLLIVGTFSGAMFATIWFFNSKIMDWILNKLTISAANNDYRNVSELLCPKEEDNLRPNIKYIPKNKRTIRLWYLDTKNKLCKPMQN